jgi:hypothetical protein
MGWSLVAILFFTLGASPPLQNSDCLACHANADLQSQAGKSVHIDGDKLKHSVHGSLACTDCHTSITGFPHPEKIQPVQCSTCHSSEADDVGQSVHAKVGALPCLNCHGNPHQILAATDPKSTVYPLNVPRTCGSCHGNPEMAKKYGLPNVFPLYMDSIHGFALSKDGLLVAANCSSCHGTHKILGPKNPKSKIYRTNIPDTCGTCHAGPKAQYFAGIHGRQLEAGNAKAPVCTDCHTAHAIANVRETSWQMKSSATCGNCHHEKFVTYLDTLHAQVSALGFVETAHCWNCHGNHDIMPASDPKSPVARANLVTTCGHCHPAASTGFVSYQPHANFRDRRAFPALWFTAKFMNLLLLSVLGFFALHTSLWFIRSVFDRRKPELPEESEESSE